ncbi:MAG: alpha/beta hydrolase, partial [Actinobacteria bacterium]|nr:alpha/beta hydrolase [Actinomycetota bacterium]
PRHLGRGDVVRVRDLPYGPYGRRNLLDVWHRRDDVTERSPVLFWIHGGAWIVGHKAQQALPMLNHLTAAGWVCVSINYRLAPRSRWPDYLVDVKRALAWTKEHIAEYGGDPGFIVAAGGSAGGHLTALTALTADDVRFQPGFESVDTSVQAAVPFYGVYDFTNRLGSRSSMDAWGFRRFLAQRVMPKPFSEDPTAYADASPLDQVRPDAPPFFVLHGSHDVLAPVADAREFVRRLREVSPEPVAFAELRGAQHAFEVFHSIRATHVIRAVERFGLWAYTRQVAPRAGTTEAPARQTG